MKAIQVMELTNDNFRKYGEFYDIIHPAGNHLGDFYPDHVLVENGGTMPMAFSSYVVKRTSEMIVTQGEYHDEACEIILPLDGDVIFHAAPPSTEPVPEKTEAFRVPKGTLVKIHAGVWHQNSFVAGNEECVHVLISLPQRTYKRDCVLVPYDAADRIKIEWNCRNEKTENGGRSDEQD